MANETKAKTTATKKPAAAKTNKDSALILISGYKKIDENYFEGVVDDLNKDNAEVYHVDLLNPFIPEMFDYDLIEHQITVLLNRALSRNTKKIRIVAIEQGAHLGAILANKLNEHQDWKLILLSPIFVWDKNTLKSIKNGVRVSGYDGEQPVKAAYDSFKILEKIRKKYLPEIYKLDFDRTVLYINKGYQTDFEKTKKLLDKKHIPYKVGNYDHNKILNTEKKEFFKIIKEEWKD